MDRREQIKFVLFVMSMTSCVAYSYGLFTMPSPFRKKESTVKPRLIESQAIDHRTDGGGTRSIFKSYAT